MGRSLGRLARPRRGADQRPQRGRAQGVQHQLERLPRNPVVPVRGRVPARRGLHDAAPGPREDRCDLGPLLETHKHDIGDILRESLEQERSTLDAYYELLKLTEGKSVALEEYSREMILLEELHLDEVNKMLRKPGEIEPFKE